MKELLGLLLLLLASLGSLVSTDPSNGNGDDNDSGNGNGGGNGVQVTAPELDPGACLGALTLLAGGTLILTDWRRSQIIPPGRGTR